MKILMVHKTHKGGVAVHVKEIIKELQKRGIEVKEITRNENLKLTSFLNSYFKMKSYFKKWDKEYDIIHTHDWSITYPAIKANIKNLVATFHGFPTSILATIFQNYCINKLNENAIVVSPAMKRKYIFATYIPNGVNLDIFKPLSNNKEFIIGICQNYNLEKIKKICKKVKIKLKKVLNFPYEKMPYFYSLLKIFISIPPRSTGFNMVWLEAMACEVPYIIGTNAGIGEILPIYKVSNFKELEKLLMEIKKREIKPLKNQRKWIIKNKLTWKEHVNKLLIIYPKIYNKINLNYLNYQFR